MLIFDKIKEFLGCAKADALLTSNVETSSNARDRIKNVTNKGDGTINIQNTTNNYYTINIDPQSLPEDWGESKELLRKRFNDGEIRFVAGQADAEIGDYKKFNDSAQSNIAQFFEGKISGTDMSYLRAGLYIGYLATVDPQKAKTVRENSIRDARSRNIINLASAGYFETYIKPIYESDPLSFNVEYEEIVKYMPETVFVNNNMTASDVVREVDKRICRSMRYHLDVRAVTVNGLNQSVKTIQEAEPILRDKYKECNIALTTEGSVSSLLKGKLRIELPLM